MRLALIGTSELFLAAARHLADVGLKPVLLGLPAQADVSELKQRTATLGIETWITQDLEQDAPTLRARGLDVIASVGWPQLVRHNALAAPRLGVVNLHPSMLPAYRGRHPVHWAFIEGEREVGVTLHLMTERFDEGPILRQDSVGIAREDDLPAVLRRMAPVACEVLAGGLRDLAAGARGRPQGTGGRYWKRRTPEDGLVDWSRSTWLIARLVNGLVEPLPNAFTWCDGRRVRLTRAPIGKETRDVLARCTDGRPVLATRDGVHLDEAWGSPGDVVARTTDGGIVVMTIDGVVLLHTDGPVPVGARLGAHALALAGR